MNRKLFFSVYFSMLLLATTMVLGEEANENNPVVVSNESVNLESETADQLLDKLDQEIASYQTKLDEAKNQVEFLMLVDELKVKFESFTSRFNNISSAIDPKDMNRITNRFSEINQKYITMLQAKKEF